MSSSQGKLFFDDAPKTPTRGAHPRKSVRAEKKQQEEVAPISSPPTSPYSAKSRRRDSRQSKNALKDVPHVGFPLVGLGKTNGVDAVLARTLSKASLSNKENEIKSQPIDCTTIIDEEASISSSEPITPVEDSDETDSVVLAPLVEELGSKVESLDQKVEKTAIAALRRSEAQDKAIDDIKCKLLDVIVSLQTLEKESANSQQSYGETAYNALQLATKLQSRLDMFEMHNKREKQFLEKKVSDSLQAEIEQRVASEEQLDIKLKTCVVNMEELKLEVASLKVVISDQKEALAAVQQRSTTDITQSSRIVDWLRSAGILSHSKIMTLRDAFVVAACVFLAGIAAIVLSRTLWKRFVRVTVRTLLERTTRLDAARIPLLR